MKWKNSRRYIVELVFTKVVAWNFISGLVSWKVEMLFGLDSRFPKMVYFVFFWFLYVFPSAMNCRQFRLHDLNVVTSVEVVVHINVKCTFPLV